MREAQSGLVATAVAHFEAPSSPTTPLQPTGPLPPSPSQVSGPNQATSQPPVSPTEASTPSSASTPATPLGDTPSPPPAKKVVDEVQLLSCHRSSWRYEAPQSAMRWHPNSGIFPKPSSYASVRCSHDQQVEGSVKRKADNTSCAAMDIVPPENPPEPKEKDTEEELHWKEAEEERFAAEGRCKENGPAGDTASISLDLPNSAKASVQNDSLDAYSAFLPDSRASHTVEDRHTPAGTTGDPSSTEGGLSDGLSFGGDLHESPGTHSGATLIDAPHQPWDPDVHQTNVVHCAGTADRTACQAAMGTQSTLEAETQTPSGKCTDTATDANHAAMVDKATEMDSSSGADFLSPRSALASLRDPLLAAFWDCIIGLQDWEERGRQCIASLEEMERHLLVDRMLETWRPLRPHSRPKSDMSVWKQFLALELQQQLSQAQKALTEAHQDLEEERAARVSLGQRVASQNAAVTAAEEEIGNLVQDIQTEKQRSDRLESEVEELQGELAAALQRSELSRALEALMETQQELVEERAGRVSLEQRIASQSAKVTAAEEEIGKLTQTIQAETQRCSQLETKVTELQRELAAALQQCESSPSSADTTQPEGPKRRVTFAKQFSSPPAPSEATVRGDDSSSSSATQPLMAQPKESSATPSNSRPLRHSATDHGSSPSSGGRAHPDQLHTLPAPREARDFVVGLEARLRASIEHQERDLKAWLVESWAIITVHATLEALQGLESAGRRRLRKEAFCGGPWAPSSICALLWRHWECCQQEVIEEEERGWRVVVDRWGAALATLPLQGQLALLRHHTAGCNAVKQEEEQERINLVRVWEAQLLALLQRQAMRQSAQQMVEVWENQRWLPFKGWGAQLLPQDPGPFSDTRGKTITLDDISSQVAHAGFVWLAAWELDISRGSGEDGWHYALDFRASTFLPQSSMRTTVRRRKWVRQCLPAKALPFCRQQEIPSTLPRPPLESWQEVSGCVFLYTATGVPLWVPPRYEGVGPIGIGLEHNPTAFTVQPLRGHLGSFQLCETRFGSILAMPHKDTGPGARLFCAPNPGKEACRLEFIYTDRAGAFQVRSSAHGRYWRVDVSSKLVVATAFPDLATDFCIISASPG